MCQSFQVESCRRRARGLPIDRDPGINPSIRSRSSTTVTTRLQLLLQVSDRCPGECVAGGYIAMISAGRCGDAICWSSHCNLIHGQLVFVASSHATTAESGIVLRRRRTKRGPAFCLPVIQCIFPKESNMLLFFAPRLLFAAGFASGRIWVFRPRFSVMARRRYRRCSASPPSG